MPRIGLTLPNQGVRFGVTTARELVDMAVEADTSRVFQSVWVGDSLLAKPRLESIVLVLVDEQDANGAVRLRLD